MQRCAHGKTLIMGECTREFVTPKESRRWLVPAIGMYKMAMTWASASELYACTDAHAPRIVIRSRIVQLTADPAVGIDPFHIIRVQDVTAIGVNSDDRLR